MRKLYLLFFAALAPLNFLGAISKNFLPINLKFVSWKLLLYKVLFLVFLLINLNSYGQIAGWDFTGANTVATWAATTFNANLNSSNLITRGAGAAASAGANSFRTVGFQNDGISTLNTDYFQVTLAASATYVVSLSTIDARFAGTGTFNASPGVTYQFAYSLDGGTTNILIGAPVTSTSLIMTQINVSGIGALQNVASGTTITIRYYASGQTTTGGWGFSSSAAGVNGLAFGGTVATCILAAEPTADASAPTFSDIGCNAMTLSWTSGNGANRMVVAKAGSAITGSPADQTTYVANSNFGSGSILNAGEFVVYQGSGNTFSCLGLAASTTYYLKVFEFNGNVCEENYFTTSPAAANQATIACSQCPQFTGALINSCATPCSEGDNELLFLNSGSYFIPVSAANIVVKYDPSPTNPATTTYTDALTTNAAYINTLNTNAGCGTLFYDGMATGKIPPNSTFIVTRSTACFDYDFSSFCASGPIYVIFSTDVSWIQGGNFSNSCAAQLRNFRTDFSAFAPGCITDYDYDPCLLTVQGDGDAVSWPIGGGAADNYFNDNCNPPIAILPISLLKFVAVYKDHAVQLKWTTSSEINNDYFTIERTIDGINFENINTIEGAGNSDRVLNYESLDKEPEFDISYYRLKQTDFDGNFSYSELVAVQIELLPVLKIITLVSIQPELQLTLTSNDTHPVSIKITDILGKIIYKKDLIKNEKYNSITISTGQFNPGMYILHITNGNEKVSRKFVLNHN